MGTLATLFHTPFTEQAVAGSSVPGDVIMLNGVQYLLDTSPDAYGNGRYRREPFDVVQQRNNVDGRDLTLLPQDIWRHQVQSWHQGAGQGNMDRDDSLPYRYAQSFGIDPWTKWEAGLLRKTDLIKATSGRGWVLPIITTDWDTGPATNLLNSGLVFVEESDGLSLIFDHGSVGSLSVGSTATPNSGSTIISAASDGRRIYTRHEDGSIYETTFNGSPSVGSVYVPGVASDGIIGWVKDFLVNTEDNVIKLISGGSGTTVWTNPSTDFRWTAMTEGDSCIYLIGSSGSRSVVHRVGVKTDGSGLDVGIVAATIPEGDIGLSVYAYAGFVAIGSYQGVRLAQASNSGDLTLGPLIPTPTAVRCLTGHDRFLWYGLSHQEFEYTVAPDSDLFPIDGAAGLGRIDLSTFTTSALTPAYAQDVFFNLDGGHPTDTQAISTASFSIGGLDARAFVLDRIGLIAESVSEAVPAGWVRHGEVTYGVSDLKAGLYTQVKTTPITGRIGVDIAYDESGFARQSTLRIIGSRESGALSMNGSRFSTMVSRVVIVGSAGASPSDVNKMTRWEVRSAPTKGRSSRWTLPIMNHETFTMNGVDVHRNPQDVVDDLISLVERGDVVTYQEAGRSYIVRAKDYQWVPNSVTPDRKAWRGMFVLVIEEVK